MADTIPEQMRAVIIGCSEAIRDGQNVSAISTFYESGGLKFGDKSKQTEWPSVEAVSALVEGAYKPRISGYTDQSRILAAVALVCALRGRMANLPMKNALLHRRTLV